MKTHICSFDIFFKSIKIQIKFPCSIQVAFKLGKEEVQSQNSFKLEKGEAVLQETLSIKSNLTYDTLNKKYLEKRAIVTIHVVSNSGKNVAGLLHIDVAKILNQPTLGKNIDRNLERCPDKNAKIKLDLTGKFLEQTQLQQQNSANVSFYSSMVRGDREASVSSLNNRSSAVLHGSPRPFLTSAQHIQHGHSHDGFTISKIDKIQSFQPRNIYESATYLETSRRQDIDKSKTISQLRMEITEKDRKITRLQIEKTSFQKEADLLKIQITNLKSKAQSKNNRQNELIFQNQRLNKKISTLESTIDSIKSSKTQLKRMQSFSTKFSSEQLAFRSQRLDELQLQYRNIKSTKQQTQRILRQSKRQCRELFEKSQDLQNSLNTLQKRLQLKQSFYKEQLRKYNEKQIELENIKIQLSNSNYSLKDQLQEVQRKLAATIRQKDKLLGDQKSKYSRKNEETKTQVQILRSQIEISSVKLNKLIQQNQKYQKTLRQRDQERLNLHQQIERTKISIIEKQKILKKGFQDELSSKIEELKQKYLNREQQLEDSLNSRNGELQNATKTLNDKSQHVKAFNQKVNDIQKKLKEKEQKNTQLSQSLETVSKRLELTRKNQEKLNIQMDELKQNYNKIKFEYDRASRQKSQIQNYNVQTKQHHIQLTFQLKNIIKELTQELQLSKNTTRIFQDEKVQFIRQIRELTEKLTSQNLNVFQLNERCSKQQQQISSKTLIIQRLSYDNQNLKTIISEQKQQYDIQCTRSQQYQSQISKLLQDSNQLVYTNEQMKRFEKTIKDKQTQLKSKYQNQSLLEVTVQKQQYQIQSLQEQIRSRMNEIQRQKNASESAKKQITSMKEQIDNLRKNDQFKAEEINKFHLQKSKLTNEKKFCEDRIQSLTQDYKKQKQEWATKFKEFLNTFYKEQNPLNMPHITQILELDDVIKDAYSKLHMFKQLQQKQAKSKVQTLQSQFDKAKSQTTEIMRNKQTQLMTKYQTAQQDFNFYKQSVRLKQLETEEQMLTMNRNFQNCVQQLNTTVSEKNILSGNYHNSLIKIEQLSAYLQQTNRQLQRAVQERNEIHRELDQQRQQKAKQLRKLNEQSSHRLESRQSNFQVQINQLEKDIKEKKRSIDNLQAQNKSLNKQIDQRIQLIKSGEKKNQDLRRQNETMSVQFNNILKKQRQLCQKVRHLEQTIQICQQKQQQSTIIGQLRQKQIQDIKSKFQKQKQHLHRKINADETEIRNLQNIYEQKNMKISLENNLLKQQLEKASRHSEHEFKRKEQQINYLNKQLINKKDQINTIQNEFDQYKRQAQFGARTTRDQLQRNLYSVESLQKRLGTMASQMKFVEDKCVVLQNQKKSLIEQLRNKQSGTGNYQSLLSENSQLKQHLSNFSNKYQLEVNQLTKCKAGLLSQIQELTFHYKQKARQTAQHYDKQIRQLTARMISISNDADERIKRVYQEKYEDRSALQFEIQCLRQELSKYTKVRVERNPLSKDQFVMQVSDSKMKLFLSEEPLRYVESWIPSLVNEVKIYQQTIYTHQKQIKQLQGQLQTATRIVQTHLQPMRPPKTPRKSTFFPISVVNQTFKNNEGSSFIQKLHQILTNVQIALRRIQDLASQLESVTQDKVIILTKTRQVYGAFLQNKTDYVKNELAAILDYSKVQSGSFYVRQTKK